MMPIPPIQCVKLLHKRIDLGRLSMSERIDDPVVVKPDTDSNSASLKDGIAWERR